MRISAVWLTDRLRDLWTEGSYRMALRVLESQEIPLDIGMPIIQGTYCLVDGDEPGMMVTQKDNWRPNPADCINEQYPDLGDLLQLLSEDNNSHIAQQSAEIKTVYGKLSKAAINGDGYGIGTYLKELLTFPPEVLVSVVGADNMDTLRRGLMPEELLSGVILTRWLTDREIECLKRTGDIALDGQQAYILELERKLEYYENEQTVPEVETLEPVLPTQVEQVTAYISERQELERAPAPEATKNYAAGYYGGWISPDGKFYPCEHFMEHDIAIGKLTDNLLPDQARDLGWLRLSKTETGWVVFTPRKSPNQRQINVLFDWENISPNREGVLATILENII
jgi:hypothetical protein